MLNECSYHTRLVMIAGGSEVPSDGLELSYDTLLHVVEALVYSKACCRPIPRAAGRSGGMC